MGNHEDDDVIHVIRKKSGEGVTSVSAGDFAMDFEGDGPFEVTFKVYKRFLADSFDESEE